MAGHQALDVPRIVPKPGRPPPRPRAQPLLVQRPVMPNGSAGVTPQGRERCVTWWRFGGTGGPRGEGSQGQPEGEGSAVTWLGRVLPAAPARPRVLPAAPTHPPTSAALSRLHRNPPGRVSCRTDGSTKVQAAWTGTQRGRHCAITDASPRPHGTETRAGEAAGGAGADPRLAHHSPHPWRGRPGPGAGPRQEGRARVTRQLCPRRGSGRAGALAVGLV